jgi:signal transduction histidine kinase
MKKFFVAFWSLILIIAFFVFSLHFQGWGLFSLATLPLVFAIALPLSLYTSHTWKLGISSNLLIVFVINLIIHLVRDQSLLPYYQYLAEFILLVLTVVASTICGKTLRKFETEYNLVSTLFADKKIPRLGDIRPLIESEFARGTRYNYPISMVLLQSKTDQNTELQQKAEFLTKLFQERIAGNELSTFLIEKSRITDILVKSEEENIYLMICPGTDRPSAEHLIERLRTAQTNGNMIDFQATIAAFPDDARSFNSLLERLTMGH